MSEAGKLQVFVNFWKQNFVAFSATEDFSDCLYLSCKRIEENYIKVYIGYVKDEENK